MILTIGMAWTQAELEQVRAAVLDLATGKRTASVSFAGPPARSRTYVPANLAELRQLLAEMERSVSAAPRFRLVEFSKGFDRG